MTPQIVRTPPPVARDPEELLRQQHTRDRVMILYGRHEGLVRAHVQAQIGGVRAASWGRPDLSSNPAAASCTALSTLYDPVEERPSGAPVLEHEDASAAEDLSELLEGAGLWPLLQRVQRDTLGLREMLLRVDSDLDADGLPTVRFRPVTPDCVEAWPDPRDPTRPIEVREYVERWDAVAQVWVWTVEVWSIRDRFGEHRILDAAGADVSERYGLPKNGRTGDAYPVQGPTGPELPYVVYHAALTGSLFDPYEQIELWRGTITSCANWTFFGHVLRNAAWAQRYALGVEIQGKVAVDGESPGAAREAVVADPSTVLMMRPSDPEGRGTAMAGQWGPAANPTEVAQANVIYDRRIHNAAGLDPADQQRTSGDPRSGYAIAVNRETKDRHALRFAPTFRRSDLQLVRLIAILLNTAFGEDLFPVTGWRLKHAPIWAIEQRAERAARSAGPAAARPRPSPTTPSPPPRDDETPDPDPDTDTDTD